MASPHGFPGAAFAQEKAIRQAPAGGDGHGRQLVAGAGDLRNGRRVMEIHGEIRWFIYG